MTRFLNGPLTAVVTTLHLSKIGPLYTATENRATALVFEALLGSIRRPNFVTAIIVRKLMGLSSGEIIWTTFSRCDTIPECRGQTKGRNFYINIV